MGNVAVYKKGTTDFFSQGLGLLSDVVSSNLTQTVSSTGNVGQKLEVEYPIDGYLVSELVEGAILRVSVSTDKSDYGVFEIVDTLKDDSGTITVYGDPYYNRILRMSFDNGGVFTKFPSVQSALNAAKQNITGFPADFNLISNLSTSVDLSENTYDTFGTFLEALNSAVHGNIKYSLNSIQLYSAIGKDITDITLRDDMNTSSVKITTDFSGIINKVIPVLPVLDKEGNATDKTKVGTIVTSKYSNQFLDYWAGKVIQFDTQDLANTYFDRTKADRPVHTVDVDPIGLDDDFSTINIFDTIELYSTRLDYTDKLRVSERVFDTLSENVTSFKLGSSSVNIFNQINEQNNEIFNNVVKLTNAAISANGKGIDYFGQAKPSSPKEGNTWFWDDGTDFGIKQYTNGEWVDLAGSNTAEKIAAGVTEAISQANAHTDEVKQGLSSDIATATSQATSQANAAEASAKSAATSQFNQAQNALSAAKSDLTNSIASEASARTQAVSAANSQAQEYVNQAKSDINDTINAFSVGGRNYYIIGNSVSGYIYNDGTVHATSQTNADMMSDFIAVSQNDTWQLTGWHAPSMDGNVVYAYYDSNKAFIAGSQSVTWFTAATPSITVPITIPSGVAYIRVSSQHMDNNQGAKVKVEKGTKPTDWTPAPEDVVLDYTTKDNKIKETITQYQETNDGLVSKAQTDATTALGLVETKISKTVYDQKTGELSRIINETKDTADKSTQTIADIQEADGKRDSRISEVEKTAGDIKSTVSDLSTEQGKQSGYISTLKQRADGFDATVTKVDNLSVGVKNLVRKLSGQNASDTGRPYINDVTNTSVYNTKGNIYTSDGLFLQIDNPKSEMYYSLVNAWTPLSQLPMLKAGETYTIGVDVVGSFDYVAFRISDVWYDPQPINHTKFERVYQQFTIPSDATQFYLRINASTNGAGETNFIDNQAMIIRNIALYNSTVKSDGAPAPEDIESDIAQVKITADGISNFVRDSSGNISSDFQTALSKTSIISDSTLASSIQKQTSSQISSALTDNNGKIISLINQDSSGVQIAGKNIVLDGNTTVTGTFWAKQVNAIKVDASYIKVGTLNGSLINITNINADNIVSGSISGANLNINLNTGSVVFQKGRINSSDYTTDINIDQGYISTADGDTRALLAQGKLQLIDPNWFSPQTNPYLEISNNSTVFNGFSALIKARDSLTVSINGYDNRGYDLPTYTETFVGLSIGKDNNSSKLMPTKIGGAEQGVIISGGVKYSASAVNLTDYPYIYVGSDSRGISPNGDRIYLNGKAVHIPSAYNVTWSASANVYIASDGSLYRASSAKKYKLDIKHNIPLSDSRKLLEIPLSTWIDKRQYREKNDETRYFGMIAEDLRDAGLEYLVQYGEDNEVEGINYDRVALLLIPLVKELKERIEELESEGK